MPDDLAPGKCSDSPNYFVDFDTPVPYAILTELVVQTFRADIVRTREGHDVVHPTRPLLDQMIGEFRLQGRLTVRERVIDKPRFFGAYALYGIQKQWIEQHQEELSLNFAGELQRDGILYRVAGPEAIEQMSRWQPVLDFLGTLGIQLPDLVSPVDREFCVDEEEFQWRKEHSTPPPDFTAVLEQQYRQMKPEQRTVTMFLHAIHSDVVLFPILLALGKCTPEQYAEAC